MHELLVADGSTPAGSWRKLRPPDGGADTLVLQAEGQVDEVIQVKHFPDGRPNWVQCEHSLDDAVTNWAPPRVTFVFSSDFTADWQKQFAERLEGRHQEVTVGALTLADIERRLDQHPHVATRFLGPDARTLTSVVERATTLGGARLETGADLSSRASELADFADEHDPLFDYEQALGSRAPNWSEMPYMSVVEETEGRRLVWTAAFRA